MMRHPAHSRGVRLQISIPQWQKMSTPCRLCRALHFIARDTAQENRKTDLSSSPQTSRETFDLNAEVGWSSSDGHRATGSGSASLSCLSGPVAPSSGAMTLDLGVRLYFARAGTLLLSRTPRLLETKHSPRSRSSNRAASTGFGAEAFTRRWRGADLDSASI
jgi:hypothetical protein